VTVECNPEGTSPVRRSCVPTRGGRDPHFARVQSLTPHVLASLGPQAQPTRRCHGRFAAIGEVGFSSSAFDLIYGARGETDDELGGNARGVLRSRPPPPHVEWPTPSRQSPAHERCGATRDRHPDNGRPGSTLLRLPMWGARRGPACPGRDLELVAHPATSVVTKHRTTGTRASNLGVAARPPAISTAAGSGTSGAPERYLAAIAANHSAVAGEERLDPDQRLLESSSWRCDTREGGRRDPHCRTTRWLAGLVGHATPAAPCSLFAVGCSRTRSRAGFRRGPASLGRRGARLPDAFLPDGR